MVLADHEIAKMVRENGLIDSFDEAQLTSIGYDLRAKQFYTSSAGADSVRLMPNESAFVESVETVAMPDDMLGIVSLRNSRIRQGLSLEAPVYQPGHKTRIYFRLTNVSASEIELNAGDTFAAIRFERLGSAPLRPYEGTFSDEFRYRGLGDYEGLYRRQIREIEKKADNVKEIEHTIYGNVLTILSVFVALFTLLTTNVSLAAGSASADRYLLFNAMLLGCVSFMAALITGMVKPAGPRSWARWIPAAMCFAAAFWLYLR